VRDLRHADELRELGSAVFIERPLGIFKAVGEPDQTLLLAHEAFSRTIAGQRLRSLAQEPELLADCAEAEALEQRLLALQVVGLPLGSIADAGRAVVSLADARRVAEDFVFLRTLPRGVSDFLEQFDVALDWLAPGQSALIVRAACPEAGPEGILTIF